MPSFADILTRVRKDPLGPNLLTTLRSNLQYVRALAAEEHIISTGEHNAMEVPRLCRRIAWSGAAYSSSPSSSDISSITNPAVGTAVVNLAASRFTTEMRVQANILGEASKPCTITAEVASATQIKLYMNRLTSALGAGNAWAATDLAFDLAIHSEPLATGTWNTVPSLASRGDFLSAYQWYERFAQEETEPYTVLRAAHLTTGAHSVREVAKMVAWVQYDSGTPKSVLTYGTSGMGLAVNRVSAGVVEVTFTAVTTPISAFVSADYSRLSGGTGADVYIMNAYESSSTKVTVHQYKYDFAGKTWSAADGDFWIAIYAN